MLQIQLRIWIWINDTELDEWVYHKIQKVFTPGEQTVSYFLLQDWKELTYKRRGSRRGRIRESETLIGTVFH